MNKAIYRTNVALALSNIFLLLGVPIFFLIVMLFVGIYSSEEPRYPILNMIVAAVLPITIASIAAYLSFNPIKNYFSKLSGHASFATLAFLILLLSLIIYGILGYGI